MIETSLCNIIFLENIVLHTSYLIYGLVYWICGLVYLTYGLVYLIYGLVYLCRWLDDVLFIEHWLNRSYQLISNLILSVLSGDGHSLQTYNTILARSSRYDFASNVFQNWSALEVSRH